MVATFGGRDIYFGRFDDPGSKIAYDRTLAEWLANGRTFPSSSPPSIAEVMLQYIRHVDGRYQSNEPANIRHALRPLRRLYGTTVATEFGPKSLKAVRQCFVDDRICRNEINKRVGRIVRMFKWATAEELIAPAIYQALRTVEWLKRGSVAVRESQPVKPVPDEFVEAVREYASRQVWAMITLQRLTGGRPGEICAMRTCDINTAGRIWEYTPERHRTQNHGKGRTIYISPSGQEVLREWLRPAMEEHLFSPTEADESRRANQRLARKTRVQPSQQNRKKRKPKQGPKDHYTAGTYRQAIKYAIRAVNRARKEKNQPEIPEWHPHQLRHNFVTLVRRKYGLDVARVLLGHSSPVVTEVYAELDQAKAIDAMLRMG